MLLISGFVQRYTSAWDGEDAYVCADVYVCVCACFCAGIEGLLRTYFPCSSFHTWLRDVGYWQLCSQPHCGGLSTWV